MSNSSPERRSEQLTEAYARYRAALDAQSGRWTAMPYHWWTLPDPVSIRWLPIPAC